MKLFVKNVSTKQLTNHKESNKQIITDSLCTTNARQFNVKLTSG